MEASDQTNADISAGTEEAPAKTTDELLHELLAEQQAHRAEVAALREQLSQVRTPPPAPSSTVQSPEELLAQRQEQISQHSHYCPGCGRLYNYLRECTGRGEAPHPPIDVVPVDELHPDADPANHTPAPNTDAPSLAV